MENNSGHASPAVFGKWGRKEGEKGREEQPGLPHIPPASQQQELHVSGCSHLPVHLSSTLWAVTWNTQSLLSLTDDPNFCLGIFKKIRSELIPLEEFVQGGVH